MSTSGLETSQEDIEGRGDKNEETEAETDKNKSATRKESTIIYKRPESLYPQQQQIVEETSNSSTQLLSHSDAEQFKAKSADDDDERANVNEIFSSITSKKPGHPKKTSISVPTARRLSHIPQQLYIKTTPAIPMNANIQHILANVARTEGPFETPAEAVKAALIAMHDDAW